MSNLSSNQYLARFRRWWYLATVGMWRGECAVDISDSKGRLCVLGSGVPIEPGVIQPHRIWWERK